MPSFASRLWPAFLLGICLAAAGCDGNSAATVDASAVQAGTESPDAITAAGRAAQAAAKPKVLLISIDGLRPDAIFRAPAKTLLALASRGAYSWQARTISPSFTLPSHASMVSGYTPEEHKLLWNDWRPGYIAVPTVFSAAKAAGLRTVMVVGKEKLQQLAIPGTVDTYVFAPEGDEDVSMKAVIEIQRGFDLLFVHLPNVDITGHSTAWMSDAYVRQVLAADAAVRRVVEALPAGTTVIVTADHGGKGYGHGNGKWEDFTIPWILSGPGVRPGHVIGQPIVTTDTAATVAHVLGVRLPPSAVGRWVQEAFLP